MKQLSHILLILFVLISSCEEPQTDVQKNPPKCKILNYKFTKATDYPNKDASLDFTVENYSSKYDAYEVSAYIKVKNGNSILEEKPTFIAISLKPGEKIAKKTNLYDLKFDSYVSKVEIQLVWKDIEDFYHSETYVY